MTEMNELVTGFFDRVLQLLPLSPFSRFIDALEKMPYLSYLNWFIPVNAFIAIGQAWLIAVALFYIYMIVLRWIKAIE